MGSQAVQSLPSDLLEVDWELLGASQPRTQHLYHWYPQLGRREVAGVLVGCLSERGDQVLDPFCGIGTVLAEAFRQDRRPVGGDINPVATLTTKARLTQINPSQWIEYINQLQHRITEYLVAQGFSRDSWELDVPNLEENRRWYHYHTLIELSAIWRAIIDISSPHDAVASASFSAILRSVSSRRGPSNRIADNVCPDALYYRPAIAPFFSQLSLYASRSRLAKGNPSDISDAVGHRIWTGPSAPILGLLPDDSIDLIVTRLPEPGVADYVRSQRLTSLWFGWNIGDYDAEEIGARFKRRRLGALAEYLAGIDKVFKEITRIIKSGHFCVLVLGTTIYKTELSGELSLMLDRQGLTIMPFLGGRMGQRRKAANPSMREDIVIARKDN